MPLYRAYGFEPFEEGEITMPDGVTLACVWMEKPIDTDGRDATNT